jgi:hypothetical protein
MLRIECDREEKVMNFERLAVWVKHINWHVDFLRERFGIGP